MCVQCALRISSTISLLCTLFSASEIGLPGGRREDTDPTFMHTALREVWEEVGIDKLTNQLQVSIYLYVSLG